MAMRGSKKELSQRHERHIATVYQGQRSESSGAAVTDEGDVRVVRVSGDNTLFECKGKFGELTGKHPVASTVLTQFEKIVDEAYSINYEPALALRFYVPGSPIATDEGWVDLVVRLLEDDLQRFRALQVHRGRPCPEEGRWR